MKYFIVTEDIAAELHLTRFRNRTKDGRYILNVSDLAPVKEYIYTRTSSVREISLEEAKKLIGK